MSSALDRDHLIDTLRRLMDALCAPGLTLAESNVLRPEVFRVIEALRRQGARDGKAPGPDVPPVLGLWCSDPEWCPDSELYGIAPDPTALVAG